ncbi:putative RDD family membrane protein YckC [Kitasatospora sp. MAA19]|uniref:RDD family protein n=1 Tax=Kitasatospora sp. MAA19 TaxID=3035090 RepID=UPI002473A40E|nr:RDD family protein [Kitasatospora sp. MAA19]MDH6707125.1 putative RDD family membrane protein YckC [Kitasatospora sp. MAA19]
MTDRPFAAAGDPAVGPEPGYYPDPSIPGFVRYWGGSAWVPGTSRPAPAEGEVLEPPRFADRRPAPGTAAARAVPPPMAPEPAVAGLAVAEPSWGGAVGGGDTGPVYLDQTTGGAKFVLGSRVAEVIGGPVFRTVGPSGVEAAAVEGPVFEGPAFGEAGFGEPVFGEPVVEVSATGLEEPGWQADPRAQRGLTETGDASRWVSWGVLPGAPEAEEGRAGEASAPIAVPAGVPAGVSSVTSVAVEAAAVAAPVTAAAPTAVAVRETLASVTGSVPVVVREVERAVEAEAEVEPEPVAPAAAVSAPVPAPTPAASLPVPRPAREAVARRRSAPAVPAGLGRRLAARAVDTAALLVVAVAAGIPLGNSASEHLQQKLDQARMASALTRRQVQVWLVDDVVLGKVAVLLGILLFVSLLCEVLPTARTGQTFGKRLARIRVVDAAAPASRTRLGLGRSLLRWAVRQLGLVLLVGLVWPVFDRPVRRGWQDRAARTRVVRD